MQALSGKSGPAGAGKGESRLYLKFPSFAEERLDITIGFFAVTEAPFIRVPDQLPGNSGRYCTQREPLDVLGRDGELRYARCAALTGANPILLVIDATL